MPGSTTALDQCDLTDFLRWFRDEMQSFWNNVEPLGLECFEQRGVGGSDWQAGTRWLQGCTEQEISLIEKEWGFVFSAEYHAFLSILNAPNRHMTKYAWLNKEPYTLQRVSDVPSFFNWQADYAHIKRAMSWPLEGIVFDVENHLWLQSWGTRAKEREARKQRVATLISEAPRLTPLFGHRYLLDHLVEGQRPILSVYQSDIIVYGTDLQSYLISEFEDCFERPYPRKKQPSKVTMNNLEQIPFWGELMLR